LTILGLVLVLVGIAALLMYLGGKHGVEAKSGTAPVLLLYKYVDKRQGGETQVIVFIGRGELGYALQRGDNHLIFYTNRSVAIQLTDSSASMLTSSGNGTYLFVKIGDSVVRLSLTRILRGVQAPPSPDKLYDELLARVNRSGVYFPIVPYRMSVEESGCREVDAVVDIGVGIPVSERVRVCVENNVVTSLEGKTLSVKLVEELGAGSGLSWFVSKVNELFDARLAEPNFAMGGPTYLGVFIRGADPAASDIIESVLSGEAEPSIAIYGDPLQALTNLTHFSVDKRGRFIVIELLDPRCPFCARLHKQVGDRLKELLRESTYIAVLTPTASSHVCGEPTPQCAKSASVWVTWANMAQAGEDVTAAIHRFYVNAAEKGFDYAAANITTVVGPEDAHNLFTEASNRLIQALRGSWLGAIVQNPVTPVLIILWPASS